MSRQVAASLRPDVGKRSRQKRGVTWATPEWPDRRVLLQGRLAGRASADAVGIEGEVEELRRFGQAQGAEDGLLARSGGGALGGRPVSGDQRDQIPVLRY